MLNKPHKSSFLKKVNKKFYKYMEENYSHLNFNRNNKNEVTFVKWEKHYEEMYEFIYIDEYYIYSPKLLLIKGITYEHSNESFVVSSINAYIRNIIIDELIEEYPEYKEFAEEFKMGKNV
jgi:hypothetical protein